MSEIEALRQRAKHLLKSARNGDPVVIAFFRDLLPRMSPLSDDTIRETIKLADVQHALARKAGQESWRALTRMLESLDPLQVSAERFLKAVRDQQNGLAADIAIAKPEIAAYSIHTAAALADSAAVARFLAADPASATRATQPDGTPPIVYAVTPDIKRRLDVSNANARETVRLLLAAGADANATAPLSDASARIPVLYFPSANNQPDIVRLLLEYGANPNDGESLYHAAQHNHRECLEVLLAHGADPSGPIEAVGNTPLYFLATHRETNPSTPTATLGMEWLLEHGADPDVESLKGANGEPLPGGAERPLHRIAAAMRPASVARMLIAHGATIDAPRGDGKTAYTMAVRAGNVDVVEHLASAGADTNAPSAVDRLVGACARADEREARALVASNPGITALFTEEDAKALLAAISDRREESVRLMLALGWPLGVESEWGGTALHWAAWNGRVALARELIAAGAPVNVRDSRYGSSPIAWAAHGSVHSSQAPDSNHVAVVEMLLDAGATRAESYNRWNESPESLASAAVRAVLKVRGFAA